MKVSALRASGGWTTNAPTHPRTHTHTHTHTQERSFFLIISSLHPEQHQVKPSTSSSSPHAILSHLCWSPLSLWISLIFLKTCSCFPRLPNPPIILPAFVFHTSHPPQNLSASPAPRKCHILGRQGCTNLKGKAEAEWKKDCSLSLYDCKPLHAPCSRIYLVY